MNLQEQATSWRRTFQQPFEIDQRDEYDRAKVIKMQRKLIREECEEVDDAITEYFYVLKHRDHFGIEVDTESMRIEILKELADVVFVCFQLAAYMGMDLLTAMFRVFLSNMSKLDSEGRPIFREDGKILKGPNYKEPNLEDLI
jgi:NTP pyrophosphatase (non-canonical NTP hydrolase)